MTDVLADLPLVFRLQRAAFRQHNDKVQLCAFDVLALDGDDYLNALPRFRASAPYRTRSRGPD
jgi:hypothetical protein